ncbi:MAG TPA: hypothetical protein PLQ35_04650 [bacterium]|nr:hypothetical protein [bacterium]HQL61563.1 hypothetical protein [bacterium]
MDLFLDNQPLAVIEDSEATIRDVINRVSDDLKGRNRVVCEVYVDEVPQGDWQNDPFAEQHIREINSLRLISEEPRRLAIKVLYDIAKYMSPIQKELVDISSFLQSRQEEQAFNRLQQLMYAWSQLYHGLNGASAILGVDHDRIAVGQQSASEIHLQVLQLLEDATRHLQEQRFLELSDLLEYELAPKMPLVEEAIYVMIREAERPQH